MPDVPAYYYNTRDMNSLEYYVTSESVAFCDKIILLKQCAEPVLAFYTTLGTQRLMDGVRH